MSRTLGPNQRKQRALPTALRPCVLSDFAVAKSDRLELDDLLREDIDFALRAKCIIDDLLATMGTPPDGTLSLEEWADLAKHRLESSSRVGDDSRRNEEIAGLYSELERLRRELAEEGVRNLRLVDERDQLRSERDDANARRRQAETSAESLAADLDKSMRDAERLRDETSHHHSEKVRELEARLRAVQRALQILESWRPRFKERVRGLLKLVAKRSREQAEKEFKQQREREATKKRVVKSEDSSRILGLEEQLAAKDREISRLCMKLEYYLRQTPD